VTHCNLFPIGTLCVPNVFDGIKTSEVTTAGINQIGKVGAVIAVSESLKTILQIVDVDADAVAARLLAPA
jgi:hypothetical protein